ncbi:MAG: FadR/GntR family transcriptional regulator [Acidobacteriota bacterium]
MYRAVRTARLYQQIVEQIEQSIRSGQLKNGDQLPPERDLAHQFGVSRTAVREAVKALCEKGLAEALPGRGTFIVDGTSKVIRQSLDFMINVGQPEGAAMLTDVREIIEPEIAARAAARVDEKQLAAMRDAVAAMDAMPADPDAYIEADLDFHLALAEAAQNPLVLTLIDSIVGLLREQRTRIFDSEDGPARGQFHHRRILHAVETGNPDEARQAMREHLLQIREDSSVGELLPEPMVNSDH